MPLLTSQQLPTRLHIGCLWQKLSDGSSRYLGSMRRDALLHRLKKDSTLFVLPLGEQPKIEIANCPHCDRELSPYHKRYKVRKKCSGCQREFYIQGCQLLPAVLDVGCCFCQTNRIVFSGQKRAYRCDRCGVCFNFKGGRLTPKNTVDDLANGRI